MGGGAEVGLIQLHRSEWYPSTTHQLQHGGLGVTCCLMVHQHWLVHDQGEDWGGGGLEQRAGWKESKCLLK